MPTDPAINISAQVMTSRRWLMTVWDVRQAFSQSLKSNRRRPLARRQPRGGPFPGANPGGLILLETEVDGLVSGPAWWRVTFLGMFTRRGYVINPFDRCSLTLPGPVPGSPTKGIALLEMDDVMGAGDKDHNRFLAAIGQDIVLGKTEVVSQHKDGVLFDGRRWLQNPTEFHISFTIRDYVNTRLHPVTITKTSRAKSEPAPVPRESRDG